MAKTEYRIKKINKNLKSEMHGENMGSAIFKET